jgi:uncharacterized membrane protein YphA (DoxX/SURF4 family)
MRAVGTGQVLFALGFAVVGAIGLGAHDFILSQQPVPAGIPWREALACASGALLLVTAVGLLIPRTARLAALVLAAYLLLWVLVLQLPRAVANPQVEGYWLGVGEDLTLATGGWIIFCAIAGRNDSSVRVARILFGLALLPIGLSHFFYLKVTVGSFRHGCLFARSWLVSRGPRISRPAWRSRSASRLGWPRRWRP